MSGRPERLSAADASNVVMDARDQVNVVLLAGILGVGGFVGERGEADLGRLREAVADRLRFLARQQHVDDRPAPASA